MDIFRAIDRKAKGHILKSCRFFNNIIRLSDDGIIVSWNKASLNILVHAVINLLYHEHWTDKRKYIYLGFFVKNR